MDGGKGGGGGGQERERDWRGMAGGEVKALVEESRI